MNKKIDQRNRKQGNQLRQKDQKQRLTKLTCESVKETAKDECQGMASLIYKSPFYNNASRHLKIKLERWLQIILKPQTSPFWKQNQFNHLKMLNLMCECGLLARPFTVFPSFERLPILHKHQMKRIIDQVESQVRSGVFHAKKQEISGQQLQSSEDNHKNYERRTLTEMADDQQSIEEEDIVIKKINIDDLSIDKQKTKTKLGIKDGLDQTSNSNRYKFHHHPSSFRKESRQKSKRPQHTYRKQENVSSRSNFYNINEEVEEECLSLHETQKLWHRNTLSSAINLQIYSHSVSEQIRKYTNNRTKLMNKSNIWQSPSLIKSSNKTSVQDPQVKQVKQSYVLNDSTLKDTHLSYIDFRRQSSAMRRTIMGNHATSQYKEDKVQSVDVGKFQTKYMQEKACCECIVFN